MIREIVIDLLSLLFVSNLILLFIMLVIAYLYQRHKRSKERQKPTQKLKGAFHAQFRYRDTHPKKR